MIKIKCLASGALVFLNFLCLQTYSSQAADMREILLIQPDGAKKAVELNLDQSLSELRNVLVQKGVNILPDDKFLVEISSQDEAQWSIREAISGDVLSFKPRITFQETLRPTGASSCNVIEKVSIPLAVQEKDEEIYQRFLKGVLIYRPQVGSDVGKIELPISALQNPLEGTFDLSQCGDVGNYISISTGYRKEKKAGNANKVEIWFVPRFLIENELQTTASHFQEVFGNWSPTAPVGIFWTWGGWDNLTFMDHAVSQSMDELSDNNLYEKHGAAVLAWWVSSAVHARSIHVALSAKKFHIHF